MRYLSIKWPRRPGPCPGGQPTARSRVRLRAGAGTRTCMDCEPDTMARITSDCGAMRSPEHQMALITSGCAQLAAQRGGEGRWLGLQDGGYWLRHRLHHFAVGGLLPPGTGAAAARAAAAGMFAADWLEAKIELAGGPETAIAELAAVAACLLAEPVSHGLQLQPLWAWVVPSCSCQLTLVRRRWASPHRPPPAPGCWSSGGTAVAAVWRPPSGCSHRPTGHATPGRLHARRAPRPSRPSACSVSRGRPSGRSAAGRPIPTSSTCSPRWWLQAACSGTVRGPRTAWTITRHDGPNHLGL